MALAEDASARLVTAVADAADVLTPEQRRALVEEHEHFHRGGWHR
jgi:Spy/CpxP family protein refolding chaperone